MSKPNRPAVPEEQLRTDAFDFAHRLMAGQGMEALDVIYGGSYEAPSDMAALLRYTAGVVQFRANQQPGASA